MEWLRQIGKWFVLMALQVLVFNRLNIAGLCCPMVYILFLINLPVPINRTGEMFVGVAAGLMMDIWCNSLGVHIAACVALCFLRPLLLKNRVQEMERVMGEVCGRTIGYREYTQCAIVLTLVHHLLVFSLGMWDIGNWWIVVLQTLISSAITLLAVLGYDRLRNA